ncbi:hypothetical protein SmaMPs15_000155 [Stenotrophomonas maltophilia phage vB_SmaM_Ps15]|uniref:Uncharacterized protein n=1 Tax=Stenotrophomonas maltophilia phage vB_SmaM_Ps15 TaxID=3071007 RepID=A0AAE9FMR9_9CAUD|nr:hypothetical protein PQC01_gp155 [Stenotrophomonas maltophilia phage vB_SmaM_Ps15]UMO77306.1 hypothetical protein SmaMPs15_000155 [Stenotrophomonas maltophilia phage vB_SmaM_Ps15]
MIIPAQYQLAAKLLAAVLAIGAIAGVSWKVTSNHYENRIATINATHEAWIAKNGEEVAKKIAAANEERATAYKELSESRGKLDEGYIKNISDLRTAVAKLGNVRLQDPGYKAPTNGSGSGTGVGNPASPGSATESYPGAGFLSQRASEFLLGQSLSADTHVEELRVCKAWVDEIEAKAKAYNLNLTKQKVK